MSGDDSNAVKSVGRTLRAVAGGYKPLADMVQRTDSWVNVITGLGTLTRDKRMANEFEATPRLSDEQLENLYHGDDMAARACDALPEEMLRQGFEIKIEAGGDDADEQGKPGDADPSEPKPSGLDVDEAVGMGSDVTLAMLHLDAVKHFMDAMVWANCFGGSAILVGANDGAGPDQTAEPLRENTIQSVDFLNVINKRHMTPMSWYTDPMAPKFGRPSTYLITPEVVAGSSNDQRKAAAQNQQGVIEVHETRLILFDGTRVTNRRRQAGDGFADSVLQRMHDVLRDFNQSWSGVAHVMADFSQGKFKIKDLISMIAAGEIETIQKRFQIMDMGRSVARAIALDAELEDFERTTADVSGVPAVLDKQMIRLSAAARMPVTILMGQSPAGMDATGVSDRQIWFDVVSARREFVAKPALARLAELIMLSKRGPTAGVVPENWRVHFPSLWQLTPLEEATLRETQSRTDKNYVDSQVVLPEEIALSRFQAQGYSADTTVDLGLRREVLDLEKDKELERAAAPDPIPPPFPGQPVPDDDDSDDDSDDDEGDD